MMRQKTNKILNLQMSILMYYTININLYKMYEIAITSE
jgi:hypothetical protein